MTNEERTKIIDAYARALYASTFQQPIEESRDVDEAWRIWRNQATLILDEGLRS